MFDSPVLNVIIGIVFIYLLYSLLASLISEIVATNLGLRARMLELAIQRMLNDDKEQHFWIQFKTAVIEYGKRILNQLQYVLPFWKRFKLEPEKTLAGKFYEQPLIKYLGDSKFFKKPPYLGKENFSKNLMDLLKELGNEMLQKENATTLEKVQAALGIGHNGKAHPRIEKDTLKYLRSLLEDANNDLDKFRASTEKWFDDTMQRASGWYKRHIQLILFTIGMALAVTFNVDTVQIITRLSKDDKARDQMVQMAAEYSKNNTVSRTKTGKDSITDLNAYHKRMDSLTKAVDSLLAKDIKNANGLVAIGWDIPKHFNSYENQCFGDDELEKDCKSCLAWVRSEKQALTDQLSRPQRLRYIACTILKDPLKVFGFFITALAISLGAPFWFDLLKKMMQLRGDGLKPENNTPSPAGNVVPTVKRVG